MSGHVAMRRWAPRCSVLSRAHIYLDMGAPCVLASRHPSSASRRAIILKRALRRRLSLSDERGFTLIELITAMGMLLIVVTALSSVLVVATKAEEDMNRRFGSQINARIALDQLRREIHCASSLTGTYTGITVVLGNRCPTAGAGTTVSWCTSGSAERYALYRQVGVTCGMSGVKRVDYLTTGNVFGFPTPDFGSLAKLSVTLPVDTKPEAGLPDYRLEDDIVLRNSVRT